MALENLDQVLQNCDNPSCVNPTHLVVGTNLDNRQDMINKLRGWWQGGITEKEIDWESLFK